MLGMGAQWQRYEPLASTETVREPTTIERTRCSQKAMTRTATGLIRASNARARCEIDNVSRSHAG